MCHHRFQRGSQHIVSQARCAAWNPEMESALSIMEVTVSNSAYLWSASHKLEEPSFVFFAEPLNDFPEPLNYRRGYAVARIFCICFQIVHWKQNRYNRELDSMHKYTIIKRGVPSAVGFPHCAGSGEGLFFKPQALPTQMCRGWGSKKT